jgi:hypothetical protein
MKPSARYAIDWTYYELAKEHYDQFCQLEDEASAIDADDPLDVEAALHPIRLKQQRSALITICFSAMCLEAFIYDYAARHISDTYAEKYLDKLDFVSKWVVIPQLVTGKQFPTGSHVFELLRFLVTTRNQLVHFKSSPFTQDRQRKLQAEEQIDSPAVVKKCFSAIRELFAELQKMDPQNQYEGFYAIDDVRQS